MTQSADLKPVLCIGEILIDLIAEPGETPATATQFAIREGGAPMNAAIGLARLGLPVRFCGAVGNDHFGARLQGLLKREGIDASALRVVEGEPTSIAYAWRDERGDGHFQLIRLADRMLGVDDIAKARITETGAVLVGSVALAASPSREAIHDAVAQAVREDVPVIFDVNVRPTLWSDQETLLEACEPVLGAATVLKLSLDDARHLWGLETPEEILERARQYDPWLVVITDGARGVHSADVGSGTIRHHPVFPVEAVDPTGAGDAFTAALVSRLMRSDWAGLADDDIRFAMAAGALATTRRGALEALPDREALERFIAEHA